MTTDPFYKAHWRDINPTRMSTYRDGFKWNNNAELVYQGAQIENGLIVGDFGCGPGWVAAEFARRVGRTGQVYAFDINPEFLDIARANAKDAGVSDWFQALESDGVTLPLADNTLDCITARNTLMYVDDPAATLREFYRVLKPGGRAHVIEGDWYMMVVEPVDHDDWRTFVKAASHACKNADMGRKLHHDFADTGFQNLEVSIHAEPDVDGRLTGMIRNMANYALESGHLSEPDIDKVWQCIKSAQADQAYLATAPQFIVTGEKSERC
ncbi:methyltransferase domain-containing protein [Shimia sp.]|uniref:methyltransferase domain-containing protein n=1 Tax=Shimia sp. TaxID=1954381 RepID=UPI003298E5F7